MSAYPQLQSNHQSSRSRTATSSVAAGVATEAAGIAFDAASVAAIRYLAPRAAPAVAEALGQAGASLGGAGPWTLALAAAAFGAYKLGKAIGDSIRGIWSAATAAQFGYAVDFSCGRPWSFVSGISTIPSVASCPLTFNAVPGFNSGTPTAISFWLDPGGLSVIRFQPAEQWVLVAPGSANAGVRSIGPGELGIPALIIGSLAFAKPDAWNPVIVAPPISISPFVKDVATDVRGYSPPVTTGAVIRPDRNDFRLPPYAPGPYVTDTHVVEVRRTSTGAVRVRSKPIVTPIVGRIPSVVPRRKDAEKKANGRAAKAIMAMGALLQGVATGNGMINALWHTLPWELQGSHYQNMFEKAERVGRYLDQVNWERASANLAKFLAARAVAGKAYAVAQEMFVKAFGAAGYNIFRAAETLQGAVEHQKRVDIFHKHLEQQRERAARRKAYYAEVRAHNLDVNKGMREKGWHWSSKRITEVNRQRAIRRAKRRH